MSLPIMHLPRQKRDSWREPALAGCRGCESRPDPKTHGRRQTPKIAQRGSADVTRALLVSSSSALVCLLHKPGPFSYRAVPATANGRAASHRAASHAAVISTDQLLSACQPLLTTPPPGGACRRSHEQAERDIAIRGIRQREELAPCGTLSRLRIVSRRRMVDACPESAPRRSAYVTRAPLGFLLLRPPAPFCALLHGLAPFHYRAVPGVSNGRASITPSCLPPPHCSATRVMSRARGRPRHPRDQVSLVSSSLRRHSLSPAPTHSNWTTSGSSPACPRRLSLLQPGPCS